MPKFDLKLRKYINKLEKAELHIHIEGSFEPADMLRIARRNNIAIPYGNVEEIKQAYQFNNLQDFLNIYYQGMNVLREELDYYELTMGYLKRAKADNCKHVEIFFDPQGHTLRGVHFETVFMGIKKALDEAKTFGLTSKLIMCFLRHLDEKDAFKTLQEAEPYLEHICGVGLDSSELGHPPSKFQNVFREARILGLHTVAHAGEEGPPEYIWEALDLLRVERIDHGNRAMEDQKLIDRLVEEKIPLTVCPLSNLKLGVISDIKDHPIKKMLDLGLNVTINSDDPAYFGGYINDNYIEVAECLNLSKSDLQQIADNSIKASF